MKFTDNFVLDPQADYRPHYRIGPFGNTDLGVNLRLSDAGSEFDTYFSRRFPDRHLLLTRNGKSALRQTLSGMGLSQNDKVAILTTTGNRYISKCVTSVIEEFCEWSREIENRTRVILVNHEFGFPYENLRALQSHGLPIIEDCCHSFASVNPEGSVASVGEHVIYSFPKFFPIQFGGLLVSRNPPSGKDDMTEPERHYIKNVVGHYVQDIEDFSMKRRRHWRSLETLLEGLDIVPRFELPESVVNGVFMFKLPFEVDLCKFRTCMNSNGIESSFFYGENTYFIPSHHRLETCDLEYFSYVIKHCLLDSAVGMRASRIQSIS